MSSRDAQSPRRMKSRRVRGPAQGGARTGLAYEAKRDRRFPPSVRSWRKVRVEEGNGGGRGKSEAKDECCPGWGVGKTVERGRRTSGFTFGCAVNVGGLQTYAV